MSQKQKVKAAPATAKRPHRQMCVGRLMKYAAKRQPPQSWFEEDSEKSLTPRKK